MWATTFVLAAVFFSTLLQHIVCYSMSPPATKRKHPGVRHRNKKDSTLGKQFDSQDEQPWLEIWGGLTHQKEFFALPK